MAWKCFTHLIISAQIRRMYEVRRLELNPSCPCPEYLLRNLSSDHYFDPFAEKNCKFFRVLLLEVLGSQYDRYRTRNYSKSIQ